MTPPGEIDTDSTSLTTNAAANTVDEVNIISAPGAGLRIRLFHVMVSPNPNTTGNVQVYNVVGGTYAPDALFAVNGDANRMGEVSFYPQGVPLNENIACRIGYRSNVASQAFLLTVHYIIESTA